MLLCDPRCVLAWADLGKGLIYDTILRLHGVGDVPLGDQWSQPDSPANMHHDAWICKVFLQELKIFHNCHILVQHQLM